jgi:hypothetical protein
VSPIRSNIEDVATPFDGELCDCTEEGSDGFDDLTLKFNKQEIIEALENNNDILKGGDTLILTLTGEFLDGTPFELEDCIIITPVGGGRKAPAAGSDHGTPIRVELYQNIPNPFTKLTAVSYKLPSMDPASSIPHHVSLKIYDLSGRVVRTLVDEEQGTGYYTILWDGRDNRGERVVPGIYFTRMVAVDGQVEVFTSIKKIILLK